jgi:hypothetical protein
MAQSRNAYSIVVVKRNGKAPLKSLKVYEKIILKMGPYE